MLFIIGIRAKAKQGPLGFKKILRYFLEFVVKIPLH